MPFTDIVRDDAFDKLATYVSCYIQPACHKVISCNNDNNDCYEKNPFCTIEETDSDVWDPYINAYLERRAACVSTTST